MTTERRFCSSCGKPVTPQDRFCGSCGSTLAAIPSQPRPEAPDSPPPASTPTLNPSSMNSAPRASTPTLPPSLAPVTQPVSRLEAVKGAFLASRKTGLFSQESLHVIVTDQRMIFAVFTNEMVKQAAKEEGKSGFLSGMLGAMTVGYNYYKHYLNMPPETALKENPQNFALEKASLRKIKLQLGRRQIDKSRHIDQYDPSKLEIETVSNKYSLSVPNNFHDLATSVLREAGLG